VKKCAAKSKGPTRTGIRIQRGSKDRGLERVRKVDSRTRYHIVSLFGGCSNVLKWRAVAAG
jgi:hypothetical protein